MSNTSFVCVAGFGGAIAVALSTAASASVVFRAVDASLTSSTLVGGDRRLDALGFVGSTTLFGDQHFSLFGDGSLTNNLGTYGWLDAIGTEVASDPATRWANPDRADNATPFADEAIGGGTLAEVFGTALGFRNMNYLIDGEDAHPWSMDLFFHGGRRLVVDGVDASIELAILERGGNSDLRVYGIRTDGTLTGPIVVPRAAMGAAGWTLNSLEIDSAQQVYGLGISLNGEWQDAVGVRIEALQGYNGPDLLGIAASAVIPGPTVPAILVAGLLASTGRRRRRSASRL